MTQVADQTTDSSPRRPASRPWVYYALGGSVVVMLLWGVALIVQVATAKPTISRNFVAEINAPIRRIPSEDRAWPAYRQAYLALKKSQANLGQFDALPGWQKWPAASAFVADHQAEMASIRAASLKPHFGYLIADQDDLPLYGDGHPELHPCEADNPMLLSTSTPFLEVMLDLRKLLKVDALREAEAGNASAALANLAALARIGEQVTAQGGTLLQSLVGSSLYTTSLSGIREILRDYGDLFGVEELQTLANTVSELRSCGNRIDLTTERMGFEDVLQRLYTDDGQGDGVITLAASDGLQDLAGDGAPIATNRWYSAPLVLFFSRFSAGRKEQLELYNESLAQAERDHAGPLWEWDAVDWSVSAELEQRAKARRCFLVALTLPSLNSMFAFPERVVMERDATLAVIAMHAFRLKHGRWPNSLEELVPEYLPVVPLDRFDGQPLRYRLVDGQPRVYGIGTNLIDDGGTEAADDKCSQFQLQSSVLKGRASGLYSTPGDWMFWPPEVRPEPENP